MYASTRTHRGFRAPARKRAAAPLSLPLLGVDGADWAFEPTRRLAEVPAPVVVASAPASAPVAPVLTLVPSPVEPLAPVRVPAGAASVRVTTSESAFRVVVVDLDDDSESSVLVTASSALAARRECTDESCAPVAVFAVLPGGESLVWGEAA